MIFTSDFQSDLWILGGGQMKSRCNTCLPQDQSVLLWGDLRLLMHNHFGDRHIWVLLLCLFNGLGQSLQSKRHTPK